MNKVENIRDEFEEVKQSQMSAHELAIYALEETHKRDKFHTRVLLVIILILLAINAYFAYAFTTTT